MNNNLYQLNPGRIQYLTKQYESRNKPTDLLIYEYLSVGVHRDEPMTVQEVAGMLLLADSPDAITTYAGHEALQPMKNSEFRSSVMEILREVAEHGEE